MRSIVFDSFALITLFEEEKGAHEVAQLLSDISAGKLDGFISAINLGEIYYITARRKGEEKAEAVLHAVLHFPLEIVAPDYHACMDAAKIKASHKMSYADAFAAALTQKKRATLITGDKEFRTMEGVPNFKVKYL